jgi:TRAP transporter 4TM/12TM fusion protein
MVTDESSARVRQCGGATGKLIKALFIALPIWILAYLLGLHIYFKTGFTLLQFLGVCLALILAAAFLIFPINKSASRSKVPWYDYLFSLMGFLVGLYPTAFYSQIIARSYVAVPYEVAISLIGVLLILEASRRTAGWIMPVMAAIFIFYGMYANIFPGIFFGRGYNWSYTIPYLFFTETGIPGMALHMICTIVLAYALFGQILLDSGGGKLISDLCVSVVGKFRGGPAKVAVLASCFFGTMSGSPGSNVVITGTFTIPMMKRIGYNPTFAAAVEAVSSTGGIIMPPVMGAAAFLMAEFLGMSYAKIVIAAIIPAVLYYICIFAQVDFRAGRENLRGLTAAEISSPWPVFKTYGWLLIGVLVLIYFLIIVRTTAEESALYAVAATFVVGLFRKETRLGPKKILQTIVSTGQSMVDIGVVGAIVGIIVGVVFLTGLGVNLSIVLTQIAGNNVVVLLLLTAIASIVLGMGLPSVPCYVILAILVAPALERMGINRMAAHMFILYYGTMSFITPPVAPAALIASAIARAPYLPTGWQACRLGIVAYLAPFVFVFNPVLLMTGSVVDIVTACITALIGVIMLSAALEGFLFRRTGWLTRILLLVGGIAFFIPGWKTDLVGLAVAVILLFIERKSVAGIIFRLAPRLRGKPDLAAAEKSFPDDENGPRS